jgi:hypothetical protein
MEDADRLAYMVESCGGWCVHWPQYPSGDSLQGWYSAEADALSALDDCQKYVDSILERR